MKTKTVKNAKKDKTFVLTTNEIDADLEKINIDGLNLERFKENPIMLYQHNGYDFPIGKWSDIKVWKTKVTAKPVFAEDDFSQKVKYFVDNGFLKGASIGFVPVKISKEYPRDKELKQQAMEIYGRDYIRVYDKAEIYEVSIVNIPSNPSALSKDYENLITKGISDDKKEFYEKYIKGIETEDNLEERVKELEIGFEKLNNKINRIEKRKNKNELLNILKG